MKKLGLLIFAWLVYLGFIGPMLVSAANYEGPIGALVLFGGLVYLSVRLFKSLKQEG